MVRSLFPGWSAIEWQDIVPGAQTERRGRGTRNVRVAGRRGACLAVRTPPAALFCPRIVVHGPRVVTTDPFHFLGDAGFLLSSGATSKVRPSASRRRCS